MSLAELMLPEFDREMAQTRKVLELVGKDHLNWKAFEQGHTVGWNANHVAEIPGWTALIVQQDDFDLVPPDGPKYTTPSLSDPAEIVAMFDQNCVAARAAIAETSDQTMAENWSMKSGGHTLFTITKGECLRTWVLNHTVHHRAILSIYLRMLGVALTPVYDG